jgi:AcrR family transcriptional regulator
MSEIPLSRPERRRQTEQRILAKARALFGARGFERTTIRAVAESAEVDPALVMQYFGSKQELFTAAVRAAPEPTFAGRPEQLADFLLDTLRLKLSESGPEPMVMLRSMLTHPAATERARQVVDRQGEQIARVLQASDAQLRAALIVSIMLGVRIGRDLLQLDSLSETPVERVLELMRLVFEALARVDA